MPRHIRTQSELERSLGGINPGYFGAAAQSLADRVPTTKLIGMESPPRRRHNYNMLHVITKLINERQP